MQNHGSAARQNHAEPCFCSTASSYDFCALNKFPYEAAKLVESEPKPDDESQEDYKSLPSGPADTKDDEVVKVTYHKPLLFLIHKPPTCFEKRFSQYPTMLILLWLQLWLHSLGSMW
ncbi:sulfite exporter TauE/SafE family protein 3 [Senna tora]|uniref:Sulfite exporter TauE/SafE family protein 3 n=1 Tax=Senna tora TaxID=362788 RepID=A0A834WZS1_9FABA|nr:sulfite exporter TauE/SafE family protein 3 [Senna tora]